MKLNSWTQNYVINSFLVNSQGRMGLYALLNCLQDVAWTHAENAGLGYKEFMREKMFWVLTRQSLHMDKWPNWGDEIRVKTWLKPPEGTAVIREFLIYDKNGLKLGAASTRWLALSSENRKPIQVETDGFLKDIFLNESVDIPTHKITAPASFDHIASFQVRNSDLDINHHVNNTKYAQWVLDAVPKKDHFEYHLYEYQVNFLAETHLGDLIHIKRETLADSDNQNKHWVCFKGVRESDSKIVFISQLLVQRK